MTKRTFLLSLLGTAGILAAAQLEKSGKLSGPVTTQIALSAPFYAAEEYHQKYHLKHGGGTCRIQ